MKNHIHNFNEFILSQDIEKRTVGLFTGKIGLSIYFYYQAQLSGNKKHKQFAEKLLDSVYSQIHNDLNIDLDNGLTGICWGIIYLIENGFVQGNPNYILKDLYEKIFRNLYFNLLADNFNTTQNELKTIVHSALYFCKRLENQKMSYNEKYCIERIIIKAINKVETSGWLEKTIEPFTFSLFDYFPAIYLRLIEKVYQLGFYTYKIEKVCDEWCVHLFTTLPSLHSHKLLLANSMECVDRHYKSKAWSDHINLLKQYIDIESVISNEFRNRNILIHNGLAGFYYFLKENNCLTGPILPFLIFFQIYCLKMNT